MKPVTSWILAFLTLAVVIFALQKPEPPLGATVQDIQTLQEAYFAKNGKYLQVIEGNKLPEYEKGSVKSKLGVLIDSKYTIDVYESPNGKGYRVRWEDAQGVHSVGHGTDAEQFTFFYPTQTSTTTP